jgi:hypothetical protein
MKTPEEILKEYGCGNIPFDENVTMLHPAIIGAMQEYAREYTLSLIEWLTRKDSPYAIVYGDEKRFVTREKDYTIEEVYEMYKQEQKQS